MQGFYFERITCQIYKIEEGGFYVEIIHYGASISVKNHIKGILLNHLLLL